MLVLLNVFFFGCFDQGGVEIMQVVDVLGDVDNFGCIVFVYYRQCCFVVRIEVFQCVFQIVGIMQIGFVLFWIEYVVVFIVWWWIYEFVDFDGFVQELVCVFIDEIFLYVQLLMEIGFVVNCLGQVSGN